MKMLEVREKSPETLRVLANILLFSNKARRARGVKVSPRVVEQFMF